MPLALLLSLTLVGSPLPKATVQIELSVGPSLSPTAPKLKVEIKNVSGAEVPLMRFSGDGCFAHFYLQLKLTTPSGEKDGAPPCAIKDFPGSAASLAAGKTERRELDLGALFPGLKWVKGKYGLEASWEPEPLVEVVGNTFAARAAQTGMSNGEFEIAPVLSTFKISRGQTVTLPGGARLSFSGHGHKDVAAGGPPSPLIIGGTLTAAGKKEAEEFSVNVPTEGDRTFVAEGHGFELRKYEYDRWMELRYFGRIEPELSR